MGNRQCEPYGGQAERRGAVLLSLGVRDQAGDDTEHFDKPTDVAFAAKVIFMFPMATAIRV